MTYKLEDFKTWLNQEPSQSKDLNWTPIFSNFVFFVERAEANKDIVSNAYQKQYQVIWKWKNLTDKTVGELMSIVSQWQEKYTRLIQQRKVSLHQEIQLIKEVLND